MIFNYFHILSFSLMKVIIYYNGKLIIFVFNCWSVKKKVSLWTLMSVLTFYLNKY